MNEEQNVSASEAVAADKSIRPVLIASERTLSEYLPYLEHLLVGLADESIPVTLVCPTDCDVDCFNSPSIEVLRHPAYDLPLPLMKHYNQKILGEKLEKYEPTLLHCLSEQKADLTRKLAKQLALPYILTVNSLQKRRKQLSISSKRCAKIIVPAKTIAANMAKFYPKLSARIEQINVGTFTEETIGCFSHSQRLASVVTAYPLDNTGDFANLLGAVRHLAIEGYEFMLVIMGRGRAEGKVWEMLSALGLSQMTVIVPGLDSWRSVLAAGDIFIQPQPSDDFSPLLLESMSVGAAVASCRDGVDDLIMEGRTCVVFNPDDELSIYGSLQYLFDRRELARKIAGGAQEYLRENYSVSRMVAALLRTYRLAQDFITH